jgi:hypothetical protein
MITLVVLCALMITVAATSWCFCQLRMHRFGFADAVCWWDHETGELHLAADAFDEVE